MAAYVVDTDADDPLATASDTDGLISLREAIEAANTNLPFGDASEGDGGLVDSITFAPSLSGQTIVLGGVELAISDDLSITGLGNNELTISGGDASGVFSIDAEAAVVVSDVTVANGASVDGGGIHNLGTLDLKRCVVTHNVAISLDAARGGGIWNGGTLSITDSTIAANTSNTLGYGINGVAGAIYNEGTLDVQNSVIEENYAFRDTGGILNAVDGTVRVAGCTFSANVGYNFNAGAIGNSGMLEVQDSRFLDNKAGSAGGAIFSDGHAMVMDSEFSGNSAFLWGGAIYSRGGEFMLRNSTLSGNSIDRYGGAIANGFGANMEIENSTLASNTADREGGAIENFVATLAVRNSTISGNSSENGGGIWNRGPLELTNVTLIENRADADGNGVGVGGALYNVLSSPRLNNSLLTGNLLGAAGNDDPNEIYGLVDPASAHNLIGDAATAGGLTDGIGGNIVGNGGAGTIDITTVLDPNLADNGGPTHTHALVPDGLAIDAGNNSLAVDSNGNPLAFDQRGAGFARVAGGAVDIGAFEAPPPIQIVEIDIKPGDDLSSINLASNGLIAVALYTTDDFNAADVDPTTVQFAGAVAAQWALEDVDGDGDLDMILHFDIHDTDLAAIYNQLLEDDVDGDGILDGTHQTSSVSLTGETTDGQQILGADEVDLFFSGKALRDLLDQLALAGNL